MRLAMRTLVLGAALLAGCAPAYSNNIDSTERPLEAVARDMVLDCAQEGHIVAVDEVGMWTLRFYLADKKGHNTVDDFTPEEVVEYDQLRNTYETLKEMFLPEMCKSVVESAHNINADEAKHWKFVE